MFVPAGNVKLFLRADAPVGQPRAWAVQRTMPSRCRRMRQDSRAMKQHHVAVVGVLMKAVWWIPFIYLLQPKVCWSGLQRNSLSKMTQKRPTATDFFLIKIKRYLSMAQIEPVRVGTDPKPKGWLTMKKQINCQGWSSNDSETATVLLVAVFVENQSSKKV